MRHQNSYVCLVCISYSDQYKLQEVYYINHIDFSQFTPMCVPKNLSNAPAQVLIQLRHRYLRSLRSVILTFSH